MEGVGGNKLIQKHTVYLSTSPALLDFPCQFPRSLIKSEVIKNLCHVLHLCFMGQYWEMFSYFELFFSLVF